MKRELFEKISALTEKEKAILEKKELNKNFHTACENFIINDMSLCDITARAHPRYVEFPLHGHAFLEIMTVFSGEIRHRIADAEITLSEGDILIMNRHTSHSIERAETKDVGMNIIISERFASIIEAELAGTMFSAFFKENSKSGGKAMYLHFCSKGNTEAENLIENLILEFACKPIDEYAIQKTLALLLYHLSKNRETLLQNDIEKTDKEAVRRAEIISYIRNKYRTASLTELAENLCISAPYLSRVTQKYFGKSFKELLLDERIRCASRLFCESDIPISNIIRSVGYENESYFHREFKKRVGTTPLALRKTARCRKNTQIEGKSADLT